MPLVLAGAAADAAISSVVMQITDRFAVIADLITTEYVNHVFSDLLVFTTSHTQSQHFDSTDGFLYRVDDPFFPSR